MKKSQNIVRTLSQLYTEDGLNYEFDVGLICSNQKIEFDMVDESSIHIDVSNPHNPKIVFNTHEWPRREVSSTATRIYSLSL